MSSCSITYFGAIYKTIERKRQAALLANLRRLRQSTVFSFTPFFVRVRSAQLLKVGLFVGLRVKFPFVQLPLCTHGNKTN
jgi:hypothetical protein